MDARVKTISQILFSSDQYLVPFFQRSYSWGKSQWTRLQDDLQALLDDAARKQHFLGPLVCTPGAHVPGEVTPYQLIDGQQRLTTLTLLLVVLRDLCDEQGHISLRDEIEEDLLIHKRKTKSQRYKLVPRIGDREMLFSLIDRKGQPDSETSIGKAHATFQKWLRQLASSEEKFRNLLTAIKDRLSLVVITITGENPYEIFESLNSTGLPLEESDLIRNFIFMQVTPLEEQDEFNEEQWRPFETLLQSSEKSMRATTFYRDYLMATGEYSKKKSTFIDFKERFKLSNLTPSSQVSELCKHLVRSRWIVGLESCGDTQIDRLLDAIVRFEVATASPLLLSLLGRWVDGRLTKSDLAESLTDIASFVLRRAVCGLSSRSYGDWFVNAIRSLGDSPKEALREFLAAKGWPSDGDFVEDLLSHPIYKSDSLKVRLALELIEDAFGHKETVDKKSLSIEHILPQNPSDESKREWQLALKFEADNWFELHQRLLHTVGNLTLSGYNRELSNRAYSEKRLELLKSNLHLNEYFAEHRQWGREEIEQRGKILAEEIARLWPNRSRSTEQSADNERRAKSVPFPIDQLRKATVVELEKRLGVLSQDAEARYSYNSGTCRLVCLASQPYRSGTSSHAWFTVTPEQVEFTGQTSESMLAFACGSPERIVLFTKDVFEKFAARIEAAEGGRYHIRFRWIGDSIAIEIPNEDPPKQDVSEYLLRSKL